MSEKGYQSLVNIIEYFGSEIVDSIIFAKDKNILEDYSTQIEGIAVQNNIKVYEKTDKYVVSTKYIVAISWRWLIPINENITLITLHDSLLPKYRGFAPLVNQLINKEPYIGVTAIVSDAEYDKGSIITQSKTQINYPIKIKDAISMVSELYVEILKNVIQQVIENDSLNTVAQNESEATYSLWRDEEDYRINWSSSAQEIQNFIFSVGHPYKGASTYLMNEKIRINNAVELDDLDVVNRDVGKIIFMEDKSPVVVCGKGLLKITEATYDKNGASIFPLKKFRIRFL